MSRSRSPGVEYSRHYIEDRPEDEVITSYTDADGNTTTVSPTAPLPTVDTDDSILRDTEVYEILEQVLIELKKLNAFAKEAMDGDVL